MNRLRWLIPLFLVALMTAVPSARAQQARRAADQPYPFFGVDLGVAEPTNDNYRAHVQTGFAADPYFGMMFNDYLGIQMNLHADFQPPDNDHRTGKSFERVFPDGSRQLEVQTGLDHENGWTTLLGATVGPRLSIPIGDLLEVYGTAQGGGFKGVSGRLNQWAPGFTVGGGLDYNITPVFAVGLFGLWNRAYMSPHPTFLIGQDLDEEGPADVRWVNAGIGVKWSFRPEAAPPPPPPPPPVAKAPPPPPPPPPTKEKIVLRAVHFDFNKANIRSDARPVLDEAVKMLKEQGSVHVIVEGHTDSIGSNAYNMKLSRRRADAVKKYLVSHGIAARRIKTEGFGKTRPVASNDTDEGRAQNRRVEIHVQ